MINKDMKETILKYYDQMTKAEKKVADFIIASPELAMQSTISGIAEQCNVGDTSVFRFCKTLGFEGFQSFKLSLALSHNQNNVYDFFDVNEVTAPGSVQETCRMVADTYSASLQNLLSQLDYRQLELAVDILYAARIIHFFGVGGSGITAQDATNKFKMVASNICNSIDSQIQLSTAALIDPQDVAVVFSYSGITREALEIARLAKQQGAKVIFVTKFSKTPAAQYADVLLVSGRNVGQMEGGSISVRLLHNFIVDILFTEYSIRLGQQGSENKQKTAMVAFNRMF